MYVKIKTGSKTNKQNLNRNNQKFNRFLSPVDDSNITNIVSAKNNYIYGHDSQQQTYKTFLLANSLL